MLLNATQMEVEVIDNLIFDKGESSKNKNWTLTYLQLLSHHNNFMEWHSTNE